MSSWNATMIRGVPVAEAAFSVAGHSRLTLRLYRNAAGVWTGLELDEPERFDLVRHPVIIIDGEALDFTGLFGMAQLIGAACYHQEPNIILARIGLSEHEPFIRRLMTGERLAVVWFTLPDYVSYRLNVALDDPGLFSDVLAPGPANAR